MKQPLAERAFLGRIGIGRGKRDTGRAAECLLQRRKIVAALRQRGRRSGERAAQERGRDQRAKPPLRRERRPHISLPIDSSMRDTSLSTDA